MTILYVDIVINIHTSDTTNSFNDVTNIVLFASVGKGFKLKHLFPLAMFAAIMPDCWSFL